MEKSFLFISCEEAKHICDKTQYGEATPWERLKLSLRLSWCRITRAYTKNNRRLTEAVKSSEIDCMDTSKKEAMKSTFQKELLNNK